MNQALSFTTGKRVCRGLRQTLMESISLCIVIYLFHFTLQTHLFGYFLCLDEFNRLTGIATGVQFTGGLGGPFQTLWIKARDTTATAFLGRIVRCHDGREGFPVAVVIIIAAASKHVAGKI
jgi:hypothetical protein